MSLTQRGEENTQVLGEIRICFCGIPLVSVMELLLKEKWVQSTSIKNFSDNSEIEIQNSRILQDIGV